MTTIEQRAFASLITRKREQIDNNAPTEKFIGDVYIHGYCNGAKEQKQIDIEKACEWLETQLDNWLVESTIRPFIDEEGINEFRKAMEE